MFDSNYIDSIIKEDNLSICCNNNIKSYKYSISNKFIESFQSNSSIKYFPNYFVNDNNNIRHFNKNDISILSLIYSKQFIILNHINNYNLNHIKDIDILYNIYYEYSNNIKWIINNNNNNNPLIKS